VDYNSDMFLVPIEPYIIQVEIEFRAFIWWQQF